MTARQVNNLTNISTVNAESNSASKRDITFNERGYNGILHVRYRKALHRWLRNMHFKGKLKEYN